MKWEHEDPTEPGWYATLHCWDANEGVFPGATQWTGSAWETENRHAAVVGYAGPFPSQEEASAWADVNDPDNSEPRAQP